MAEEGEVRMQPSFRLGRIAGIEIGVHWTVVFIVAIVGWSLSAGVLPETAPGYETWQYWLAGVLTAFAFGGSILAHELSHSVVATRDGVPVDSIVLWLFGGVAKLRSHATTARTELRIALAGPLMSLLIGAVFLLLAVVSEAADVSGLLTATFAWFGATNILLAVFNLLPGAPLDGGRVLTAILWRRSGDQHRARARASAAGRVLGQVLIALGLLQFAFMGAGGLWTALIGWLIVSMARMEMAQNDVAAVFSGVTAADVMTRDPVTVPADTTVEAFVHGPWFDARVSTFPLVDPAGRPVGLVTMKDLGRVAREAWSSTLLAQIAAPIDDVARAQPTDALIDVLQRVGDDRARVLVTRGDRLVGIISPVDVSRAFERLSLSTGSRARSTVAAPSGPRRSTLPPPPG